MNLSKEDVLLLLNLLDEKIQSELDLGNVPEEYVNLVSKLIVGYSNKTKGD